MSSLTKEEFEKYQQAGKIAIEVMKKAKKFMTKNRKLSVICNSLEAEIMNLGGKPAFPVNISINQIAAHYTSPIDDKLAIPERALVKVDLGVHIDGYISDCAKTFLVGATKTYQELKQTAELALEKVIEIIKPGIKTSDIGEVIERTIRKHGCTPITDLTGHAIERYKLHTNITIPNYKPKIDIFTHKLKEGQVIAIEPFVTTAEGSEKVYDESYSFIFSQLARKAKSEDSKKLVKEIEKYHSLPFALRWLEDLLPETRLFEALKELISLKTLHRYPLLVSKSKTPVAQAEHTVIITANGVEVITRD